MKFTIACVLAVSSCTTLTSAAAIAAIPATKTFDDLSLTTTSTPGSFITGTPDAEPTPALHFEKRKEIPATTTSDPPPKPWLRTKAFPSTTLVEVVTPTVWEGVTFSASPRTELKTPLPWLSLDKGGKIKTIQPKLKHGITENGRPDYGTWFEEAITTTVNLKGVVDGIVEDTPHEEIKYIPEDTTERDFNPIIRCTPDRYFAKKRKLEKIPSAPFCTPRDASNLILDEVYWISWFTKHYPGAEKVRLHLAYIEKNRYGGIGKRDTILEKRDSEEAFWSSDWMTNLDGVFPLRIVDDFFLDKSPVHDVMLTLQPDTMADEDFNLINGTYLKIYRQAIKTKKINKLRTEEDENSSGAIYVALTIPTLMVVVLLGYAIFNFVVRDSRTWKKMKLRSKRRIWSNPKYKQLPTNSYELN